MAGGEPGFEDGLGVNRNDVTVVVPTHDRCELVQESLWSILSQREVDPTVVVVDDGSSDGTAERLRGVFGDRIHVERIEAAGGAAAARNAGLGLVTTPWVAFCDDDDLWAPDKLSAQLRVLDAGEARWCATGAVCVDTELQVTECQRLDAGGDVLATLLRRNLVPGGGSAVVADAELVREVGGYDVTQPSSEDWDLWIRLAARSPLAMVDRPLVAYRVWAGGKSRKTARMAAGFDAITARYADLAAAQGVRPDREGHQRFLAKQQLRAGDRLGAARRFAGVGDRRRALAALVAPRTMDRIGSGRQRRALPAAWVDEARSWLRNLPTAPPALGADAR